MLWHEISMLAQAIARPLDLDDDGVMEQAIEQSRRDDGIAEEFAPFGEAAVGGNEVNAISTTSARKSFGRRYFGAPVPTGNQIRTY